MLTDPTKKRLEYKKSALNKEDLQAEPFRQFSIWYKEAVASDLREANAMTLATADRAGLPSARIVLLRGFDEKGFVFYTNYASKKGNDLLQNPHAALLFFWDILERQVRIEGHVQKLPAAESDQYFNSRPLGSRLASMASPQSRVIESREVLENSVKEMEKHYLGVKFPERPSNWGGYRVIPKSIEFCKDELVDYMIEFATGRKKVCGLLKGWLLD